MRTAAMLAILLALRATRRNRRARASNLCKISLRVIHGGEL